jgi:uncharacterized protein YciI
MFRSIFTFLAMSFLILTGCKEKVTEEGFQIVRKEGDSSGFDTVLAKRTGADEYRMKQYIMAFLKAGPNRDQDSVTAAKLQQAHMDNIARMAEEGTLVVAGPFMDETDMKGIYIFNVATVEEAKKLTETDPAVKAGRLIMELHPWYGSAALVEINSIHKKLSEKAI